MGGSEVEAKEMLLQFIGDCSINSKEKYQIIIIIISATEIEGQPENYLHGHSC